MMQMPTGACPANLDGQLSVYGAIITYRGTWDGVSLRTDIGGCNGALTSIRGQNPTPITLYAHFKGRKGTPRTITMPPGYDQTFTNPQLKNNGFNDVTDIEGIAVTTSPNDPVGW